MVAGIGFAVLNEKTGENLVKAGLTKAADALAEAPFGTAVNTATSNAEKIGQWDDGKRAPPARTPLFSTAKIVRNT